MLLLVICSFFFNDTATTEIYTLSLHDALPISLMFDDNASGTFVILCTLSIIASWLSTKHFSKPQSMSQQKNLCDNHDGGQRRSEEHTSELQSLTNLVCRLLLEKKKKKTIYDEV